MESSFILKTCACSIIGSAVLYLLYKRHKSAIDPRTTKIKTSRRSQIEIKIPKDLSSRIIGRRGANVKEIQQETQTKIFFDKIPSDDEHVSCVISGKPENLTLAESVIRHIIASQPKKETYEMFIPEDDLGKLMGIRGRNINKIQKDSGATVHFSSDVEKQDSVLVRKLTIEGSTEEIARCIPIIEHCIQENDLIHLFYDAKTSTPKKDDHEKVLHSETTNGNSEAKIENSGEKILMLEADIQNSEPTILNPEEKIEQTKCEIDNN